MAPFYLRRVLSALSLLLLFTSRSQAQTPAASPCSVPSLQLPARLTIDAGDTTTLRVTPQVAVLEFDGRADIVTFAGPAATLLPNIVNTFTVEAWVHPTAPHEIDQQLAYGIDGVFNQRYLIFPQHGEVWGDGHAGMGISVGTNGVSIYEHAGNYLPALLVWPGTLTDWTHVAVVYRAGRPTLFINGDSVARGEQSPMAYVHPSLNIGGLDYGFFQGQVREVRYWGEARSAAALREGYRHTLPQVSGPLLAGWHLDEGSGNTTADLGPNQYTGHLVRRGGSTGRSGPQWTEPTVVPAPPALTYQWSPATGLESTQGAQVRAHPLTTTTYTVTATDGGICSPLTRTVTVQVLPAALALARNLPDDQNRGLVLTTPPPAADAAAAKPTDINYVRTWVPQVALTSLASEAETSIALVNPGFEQEQSNVNLPTGWHVVTGSGTDPHANFTEGNPPAHSGNYHGTHYRPYNPDAYDYFDVYTYQTVRNLPAGRYRVGAWVRSNDGHSPSVLRVQNYGGGRREIGLPNQSGPDITTWTRLELADVLVTNGQCEIGFYSHALGGQAFFFDDVTLVRQADPAQPGPSVAQAQRTTQYLDGLGRPVQTVRHEASPQHRDLVQPQAYDALGRESRQYLPYPADTARAMAANHVGPHGYRYQALNDQQQFYRRTTTPGGGQGPLDPTDPIRGVARTGAAFAESLFEASPLNRVLAQGAPGEIWQLGKNHIQERSERPNTAADSVLRFQPGYDPKSLDPSYQGFYAPGELWGTEVSDAHGPSEPGAQGYKTIEWKDKLGQVVLKQVEANRTGTGSNAQSRWLRTAYAYDDFQRLRFVVQPQGVQAMLATLAAVPQGAPAGVSSRGLQVWLPLEETQGMRAFDASGSGNHGVVQGGTWQPTGGHDGRGALQLLNGEFATIPLTWQPTTYSVAFWLKPTQRFNWSQGTGAVAGWGAFLFHSTVDGGVYVGTDVPTRIHIGTANTVEEGVWQHFVFTFDQGVGTFYKNGQALASQGGMSLPAPWQGFRLGASGNELYDEVRVYDRALTGTEVTALYQGPLATVALTAPPFTFHYRYDGRGRQIAKQVPGQDGETLVVYDQLDRPVLSQDAQQRTRREWSWTKYDALGRAVLSGLVSRADTMGQVRLQALATADTATAHQYEQRTTGNTYQYYTATRSFPQLGQQGFSAGQVLTATYYDDYDFDNDGTADVAYDAQSDAQFPSGQAPVADVLRTQSLTTRTKTRVLGVAANDPKQTDWLTTTTFYDERARPVQVQSTNARRDTVSGKPFTDLLTTQLDFTGKVVQSVALHQGPKLSTPVQVAEFFTYDHTGRLLITRQQVSSEAQPTQVAAMQYNELGQATRKTLGTGRLKQDVDYAYNIRGWLTSLNDPAQPDPSDLFSLSLHYETGFTKGYEQYNGNLTGQTWRGRDGVQRAYGYVYDPLNRLLQGDFVARAGGSQGTLSTATAWNQELDNYRLSFVSYDDNGNINTLRRRGLLQNATSKAAKQYGAVDNLSYAYVGNRLQAVDDQVTVNQLPKPTTYHGAPTSLAGDFQEAGVRQGQEYLYDANGNLTADKNKGITGIAYNHLNLPRQIHFGQVGDSVVFRYSAAGQKVAKLVYQTGKPAQRTDYLGSYQYEQDSLRFFSYAEGRVLRFVSYDAANQPSVRYQREYTIKDHLGNLRLAYRAGQVRTLTATLEQDDNTKKRETQQFDSLSVSPPVAVATPLAHSDNYAARLNAGGSTPQPLGPLTQLGVQKGDTVTVTAFGMYPQAQQHGFFFSLASFIAGLLHPAQAPPAGLEASKRKNLPLLQVGLSAGLASLPQLSGGVPQGYLRLLIFNRDSALVGQQVQQLTQAAQGGYEQLRLQLVLPQDGYVTAYVGNESDVDVFFDDISVEHRPGLQVQETQYDPAGLELARLAAPSPGIRGLNNYRFNGKEFQTDLGLAWNHQDWRFFDPQLLRWHAGDPELESGQESWTPYSFGYDNAVRYADANGREPYGPGQPTPAKPFHFNYSYRNSGGVHVYRGTVTNGIVNSSLSHLKGSAKNLDNISNKSAGVLATSMAKAHVNTVHVTSTHRSPRQDAAAMYTNAAKPNGVADGYKLYGHNGDKIVDSYVAARGVGLNREQTIDRMTATIEQIGPTKVSHHAFDPAVLNVIDMSKIALGIQARSFNTALLANPEVQTFFSPYTVPHRDPAFHVEIPPSPPSTSTPTPMK